MAIYKNITSASSAVTLVGKNQLFSKSNYAVQSISISNNSTNAGTVNVYTFDASTDPDTYFYICKNIVIPSGAALVLDEGFTFDNTRYSLRIYNTGTSPDLTVIIK